MCSCGIAFTIDEECQPESTIVIMADAKVQGVDEFQRGEAIKFNIEAFGGTDFRPAFEHVDHEHLSPACLVYLTERTGLSGRAIYISDALGDHDTQPSSAMRGAV